MILRFWHKVTTQQASGRSRYGTLLTQKMVQKIYLTKNEQNGFGRSFCIPKIDLFEVWSNFFLPPPPRTKGLQSTRKKFSIPVGIFFRWPPNGHIFAPPPNIFVSQEKTSFLCTIGYWDLCASFDVRMSFLRPLDVFQWGSKNTLTVTLAAILDVKA